MPDPLSRSAVSSPQRPNRLAPRDRLCYLIAALVALVTGCAGYLMRLDGYHWFLIFAGGTLAIVAGLNPFTYRGSGSDGGERM